MYNKLIEAIASKLDNTYNLNVYVDSVTQGLKQPCFFVQLLEAFQKRVLMGRFLLEVSVCVQYLPLDKKNASMECHSIAQELSQLLEVITIEKHKQARGRQIRHNLSGDVLNFFINYSYYIEETQTEKTYMEQLKQK